MSELMTYEEAGKSLNPPKTSTTIDRWVRYGLRGVRLSPTWVGGSPRVSPAALERFVEQLTAARSGKS